MRLKNRKPVSGIVFSPAARLHWLVTFALINSVLVFAIGIRNAVLIGASSGVYAAIGKLGYAAVWFFIITANLGQALLLVGIALSVTLALPLYFRCRPLILPLAIVVMSVVNSYLLVDSFVYALYRYHLNGILLKLLFAQGIQQTFSVGMQPVFAVSWREGCCLAMALFFIVSVEAALAYGLWIKKIWLKYPTPWLIVGFGSLLISYFMLLIAYDDTRQNFILSLRNHEISIRARAIPLYYDIISGIFPQHYGLARLSVAGSDFFRQPIKPTAPLHYPLHPLTFMPNKSKYNILIIGADAWRADMLTQDITPNAFRLMQDGLYFTNHFSGGNATQPGLFSLFYSLPPSYWDAMLSQQQGPLFIHVLLQQHYTLNILTSAENAIPPLNKTLFREVSPLREVAPGATPAQRDAHLVQDFQQFLLQRNVTKPFFSFLFFDTSHGYCSEVDYPTPFQPALSHCERYALNNNTDKLPYLNRYKNALHYVDRLMGDVLAILDRQHLRNNTIVILLGDHGEEFNDNKQNYWGHASAFSDYQLMTPLIIRWPGQHARRFAQMTTHYDVVPTLMQAVLGVNNPSIDYSVGKSLFDPVDPDFLLLGSYIHSAIWQPDRVTEILPTGGYLIYDRKTYALQTNAQLDTAVVKRGFMLMRRYIM